MSNPQLLRGRKALVTGASGNIGRTIAKRIAAAGASVLVHYHRDADGASETVDDIVAAGGQAMALQADLGSEEQANAMFASIDRDWGPVNRIVNNAAAQPVTPLSDINGSEWRAVLAANLDSACYVTQAAVRQLSETGESGAIVNIASIEGADPATGHSHYATSKAGLLMFTRACALEYGRAGIRCNAVSPGLIDRDGLADDWPEGVARWLDKSPLGRLGTADDVAAAVLFLLGPESGWISGANVVVDGGMSSVSRW